MHEVQRPGPLLIVDDNAGVRSALRRFMLLHFDQVFTAGTPEEAEAILQAHRPRLLLCDYWLGNEFPPGTELIPRWRECYPTLECVVLMTGTKAESLGLITCLDAVFQKPLKLQQVIAFLLGQVMQGTVSP
jgi:DNA-binding NtrC family response regulator